MIRQTTAERSACIEARPTIAVAFAQPLAERARRWRRREWCLAPEVLAVAAAGTIVSVNAETSVRMPIAILDKRRRPAEIAFEGWGRVGIGEKIVRKSTSLTAGLA